MTNLGTENFGRQKNDEKLRMFIRDSENTLQYAPSDYTGNKFFGSWNKVMNMQSLLHNESREKYYNRYNAELKAELELETVPVCFDQCASDDMAAGLTSREKNCLRDCYFKKVSSKDDLNMMLQQKTVFENAKAMRERLV